MVFRTGASVCKIVPMLKTGYMSDNCRATIDLIHNEMLARPTKPNRNYCPFALSLPPEVTTHDVLM